MILIGCGWTGAGRGANHPQTDTPIAAGQHRPTHNTSRRKAKRCSAQTGAKAAGNNRLIRRLIVLRRLWLRLRLRLRLLRGRHHACACTTTSCSACACACTCSALLCRLECAQHCLAQLN